MQQAACLVVTTVFFFDCTTVGRVSNSKRTQTLTFPSVLVPDDMNLRRGSWSVCFSCICLFVLYVLVFISFLFLLVSGVGCGL